MLRSVTSLLLLIALALSFCISVDSTAQLRSSSFSRDTPSVAKAIYGNIYSSSTTGQEALVLLNPSIPLELSSIETERNLQRLADQLPEPQWIFSAKKELLRDVLSLIAEKAHFAKGGEPGSLKVELTEEEEQLLFLNNDPNQPSELYKRYLELNRRITDASVAIRKEADPNKRSQLDLERSEASLRLAALPRIDEIRSAARKIAGIRTSPPTINNRHIRRMIQVYQGPRFVPSIDKWAESSGWVRVEASVDESYNSPIFSVGPSNLTDRWWSPAALDKLFGKRITKLRFDLKRVIVDRPGLDLMVLDRRNWKFDDDTVISDGQRLADGLSPKGSMPLLITGFLLCRNIVVVTPSSSAAQSEVLKASLHDNVQFGTLSLGGAYPDSASQARYYPALSSRGITSPEVQVIALLCNQLPKTPNPDSNLNW